MKKSILFLPLSFVTVLLLISVAFQQVYAGAWTPTPSWQKATPKPWIAPTKSWQKATPKPWVAPTKSWQKATPKPWSSPTKVWQIATPIVGQPSATPKPTLSSPTRPIVVMPTVNWQPPSDLPRATHTLKQVATLENDTRVTVVGKVVATSSFSKGYNFVINDTTGTATILIWASIYDKCTQCNVLNVGAAVNISGVIERYNNVLQIVPLFGDAIRVTQPAPSTPFIVSITNLGGFVDQSVSIQGTVQSVAQTQYGTEIVVKDDTGSAEIFVWSNTWPRIPGYSQIRAGAKIQASGMVSVYRSQYTITPSIPYDVKIVQ